MRNAKNGHHLFSAVCARFMLPDQGMTQYEVLSRASAFAIDLGALMHKAGIASGDIPHDTPVLTTDGSYHPIATSLHVVRPFLFPRYYPDEWLQFIRPENILSLIHI